ncbi:CoA transferase [Achromobacter insolitus]|jgi:formyl-CoA transferase|uniref:CaiB/BaiF CoA transferase family protein n=1 Tax=Achromobacter TaxID=222 RepID=UPI0007C2222A|nr:MULTISPECIES: CoA transferase [Achromobacter]GLK94842.1 CoA transferase [Achromobacter xylosoxidans]APX77472.1 formyl-CoA transferase [Achromobacter insolitus]AVG42589.1 CoA transferase [Achromobacter insolitus]AXA73346.1 CoA transferase [Achromobacter insolitus]MCP1399881.1 formyl-CoA transferase [Achromobacter insolitus]
MSSKPLSGIRVLELGQLIAGPFAAKMLGEFGAEVIKIEPPGKGDPLRNWRLIHDGTSVWWQVQSRNKKSVSLDLRKPEAQDLIRTLVKDIDVVVENFKPGTMEGWGLGWEELRAINPRLVMLRVSGYGQTGPYRDLPGFGAIGEAMGGLRHLSGEPDRTPVRVGVSIGDSLSALHGVIGILLALRARDQNGTGQMIDVALYESVFNMMESLLPEYSVFGEIRQPAGSSLPGIAPSNAYRCQDNKYVLIAGNGDSIFKRLMGVIGRLDLAEAPELANNAGRVKHVVMLDDAISQWTGQHPLDEVLARLNDGQIPAGKIYDVADIAADPHYRARGMILDGALPDGTPVQVPGIVPKLSETPGEVRSSAPALGQDTDEVLGGLGIDEAQRQDWRARGII